MSRNQGVITTRKEKKRVAESESEPDLDRRMDKGAVMSRNEGVIGTR